MKIHDPRHALLHSASDDSEVWDIIVVGGGASGLNAAWEAVSRGLKVALLEQSDFAKSTSSKSTKLVHGGVRYLQNLEIGLVREAFYERQLLMENAPEFCRQLEFVLPCKNWFSKGYYRIGLALYDFLGHLSRGDEMFHFPRSRGLSKSGVLERIPGLQLPRLGGGVSYSDAQFDDAGLAIALAQVINGSHGAGLALNYVSVDRIENTAGNQKVVQVRDVEHGHSWEMRCKCVINATGVFSDQFRQDQGIEQQWKVQMSRGAHIVCSGDVLGDSNALIIPKTSDGRVMFAIPWLGHTVIGTTDVATDEASLDPLPSADETDFLLRESGLALGVEPSQVLSQWAGLRPLVSKANTATKSLSRKHVIEMSNDGIISILGGKWTTARAMGEDAIDVAVEAFDLIADTSQTAYRPLINYGAQIPISMLPAGECAIKEAVSHYYARTIDDVLSRRMRTLLLDAGKARKEAEAVSHTMAKLLAWTEAKRLTELEKFLRLTDDYVFE